MEDQYQLFPLLLGHVPLFLLPATHAVASAPSCPLPLPHYTSLLPDLPLGLSLATWKQSNTKLPSPNTAFLPFHMLASHKTIVVHIYRQKYDKSRKSIPSGPSFELCWAVLLTKVEWLSNLQSLTRPAKCHFFYMTRFLGWKCLPQKVHYFDNTKFGTMQHKWQNKLT